MVEGGEDQSFLDLIDGEADEQADGVVGCQGRVALPRRRVRRDPRRGPRDPRALRSVAARHHGHRRRRHHAADQHDRDGRQRPRAARHREDSRRRLYRSACSGRRLACRGAGRLARRKERRDFKRARKFAAKSGRRDARPLRQAGRPPPLGCTNDFGLVAGIGREIFAGGHGKCGARNGAP